MTKRRIRHSLAPVIAITFPCLFAGQSVHAAVVAARSTSPSAVTSSGIGLRQGLNKAGNGVLANAVYYQRALKSKLWLQTPDGMVYRSCFYSVPNGSKVDSIHGRITLPSGAVRPLSRCAYPRLVRPTASAAAMAPATTFRPPTTNGWLYDFTDMNPPGPLAEVSGNYAVPTNPSQPNSNANEFAFTSFETPAGNSIVQPVIGWGYSPTIDNGITTIHGGPYLWEAAYYAWGGNAVAATFHGVSAGDTISFVMEASGCDSAGGGCTWYISMSDVNRNLPSYFSVVSSPVYVDYSGGVFESHGATNCNQLFSNAHLVWRNLTAMYFTNASADVVAAFKPNFTLNPLNIEEKPCSLYAINYQSGTGGDILWTP